METFKSKFHHRISQRKKEANDFEWYKHHLDLLNKISFNSDFGENDMYTRLQSNYDLFNNIINKEEFNYITKPFGDVGGELPADFVNRDIVSSKIKVLLGLEAKRPFSWRAFAVNEEATTRKEQEEFNRIKEYVVSEIMRPIVAEIRKKSQGENLSPEQARQIEQQVQEEIKAQTPDEVRKYMLRQHQDPAEALANQLLTYFIEKIKIQDKFDEGWKHATIGAREIYWEGITSYGPDIFVVNPLRFDCDKSPDVKYIEDGEWAVAEYYMSPSQIVSMFAGELTNEEIDKIYNYNPYGAGDAMTFSFKEHSYDIDNTVRVIHANFKSLKKIGYLTSINQKTGEIEESIQDEWYKFNPEMGDIKIEWDYIPEVHEGYLIGADVYKRMRPVPGQFRDINNILECKLSYKGALYDNLNSVPTSIMDRMKSYQFYYNVIMYRIEMLMASDKGKIVLLNLNMIPKSQGIDTKKFLYYAEALKIGFLNPAEEGNRNGGANIGEAAKEIDLSLTTQIKNYIELAEYIERRCGQSVGITKAMEGMTEANQSVTNNQMNFTQNSYILEPYFALHNQVKRNVLEGFLKSAVTYYSGKNATKLAYVLDDLSMNMLKVNPELLDNNTYGIFVANSSKAWDAKQAIEQLSHAAMQNQKAELSDVIKVLRSDSVQEAEELLIKAEETATERLQSLEQIRNKALAEEAEKERAWEREKLEFERETLILKERERRETEIQKQLILSMGFNEDKDLDKDGTPDIMEVALKGIEANIKRRKQLLDERKFEHEVEQDAIDTELEKKKIAKSGSSKK